MIQVNRIYLIFNRLVTKKFLVDTSVPNYNRVKEFAKEVADKVLHHRLLALDIMLDEQGNPKLIEVNVGGFSAWLFQYTNGSAFGQYTDEVISFLKKKK